jgi:replicative DNA helicase
MSIGSQYLSALIAEGSVMTLLQAGSISHLFTASEAETAKCVLDHAKKYHKLPDPLTVAQHTGEKLPKFAEPSAYYLDMMRRRYTQTAMIKAMKEVSELIKEPATVEQAQQIMVERMLDLAGQQTQKQVYDLRECRDMIIAAYAAKLNKEEEYGLHLGWPYLDDMSGGLGKGDVLSFVGRPAQGKTWMLLFAALHGWLKQGKSKAAEYNQSRMFVSMEIDVLTIQERLASMIASVPFGQLKKANLATPNMTKLKKGLLEIKAFGTGFYIVDGNLNATVEELYVLARMYNPGAIFIDGGYLLKHPKEKDRFKRVAENADLIKSLLAPIAPVAVSWQFAKSAAKKNKKNGETADLEDIGYSDAIAQVSSLVLGLMEDETVETIQSRKVKVLKGRNGEVGEFRTHWDFVDMDFSEILEQEPQDLQFL